jgi:hypothetical protein
MFIHLSADPPSCLPACQPLSLICPGKNWLLFQAKTFSYFLFSPNTVRGSKMTDSWQE